MLVLPRIVRQVAKCADSYSSRYALNGVQVNQLPDNATEMVATDGRKLVHVVGPNLNGADVDSQNHVQRIEGFNPLANGVTSAILPTKAIEYAFQSIPMENDNWRNRLYVTLEDSTTTVRTKVTIARQGSIRNGIVQQVYGVEGRFPRWREVFPNSEPVVTGKCNAMALRRDARKLGVEKDGTVQIELDIDENGKAYAGTERTKTSILVGVSLLAQLLDVIVALSGKRSGDDMTLEMWDDSKPVKLTAHVKETAVNALLMPLYRGR